MTAAPPRLLAAVWLALAVAVLAGCGAPAGRATGSRDTPSEPVAGGTLVYARGNDAVGLDPGGETDGESMKVCDNIYDNLVTYAAETTDIVPELATRWEVSPDGRTYTFTLRPGVRFHDGEPLTAAAVVFSLDRQREKKPPHPFHAVGGPFVYWSSMSMDDIVDGIGAPNDSTVVFRLKRPNAPFLANLAMNFAGIVSPKALERHGADYFKNPVGTGPFRFVEWVKDDRIVLERNPDYWGEPAHLDRVIFRSIPENTVRLLALEKGDVHGMDGISPLEAQRIDRQKSLELLRRPGMNVAYLAMNMEKEPFTKAEVRRAMNHAIDRTALVNGLYMGYGTPAVNPIPPSMWGFAETVTGYAYDPEAARRLLAEAKVPPGTKIELYAMSNPRPYMPEPLKVAEVLQANLRAVGLDAQIRTMEWGTYLDFLQNLKAPCAIIGWSGDNGDPDNFLYVLLDRESARIPAQNYSAYKSDELHEVLVEAQTAVDHARRVELYRQAQEIVHRDAPWVPLAHMDQLVAFRRGVHGFHVHPTARVKLKTVWMEPSL